MPPDTGGDGTGPANPGKVRPSGSADDELLATANSLEAATDRLLGSDDPSIPDILGAYYLAMSAKAAAAASGGDAARKCADAVRRFDRTLHPRMAECLSRAVRERSDILLARGRDGTGGGTEAYSELRSMMSVREFVGQYGSI